MARKKEKREIILMSAADLFAKNGFHETNITDIAHSAEIGKGTVYEYFSSKDDLYIEVVKFNIERYLTRIRTCILSYDHFEGKLDAFIDHHSEIVHENMRATGMMIENPNQFKIPNGMHEALKLLMAARFEVIQIILDILELGQAEGRFKSDNLAYFSDLFFDMLNRTAMRKHIFKLDESNFIKEKDLLVQMLVKGIC